MDWWGREGSHEMSGRLVEGQLVGLKTEGMEAVVDRDQPSTTLWEKVVIVLENRRGNSTL